MKALYLTNEGLNEIEKTAHKHKNVNLLFLIEIYRMLKILLEKQEDTSDSGNNGTDCTKDSNN